MALRKVFEYLGKGTPNFISKAYREVVKLLSCGARFFQKLAIFVFRATTPKPAEQANTQLDIDNQTLGDISPAQQVNEETPLNESQHANLDAGNSNADASAADMTVSDVEASQVPLPEDSDLDISPDMEAVDTNLAIIETSNITPIDISTDTVIFNIVTVDTIIEEASIINSISIDTDMVNTTTIDSLTVDKPFHGDIPIVNIIVDTTKVDGRIVDVTIVDTPMADTHTVDNFVIDTIIVDNTIVDAPFLGADFVDLEIVDTQSVDLEDIDTDLAEVDASNTTSIDTESVDTEGDSSLESAINSNGSISKGDESVRASSPDTQPEDDVPMTIVYSKLSPLARDFEMTTAKKLSPLAWEFKMVTTKKLSLLAREFKTAPPKNLSPLAREFEMPQNWEPITAVEECGMVKKLTTKEMADFNDQYTMTLEFPQNSPKATTSSPPKEDRTFAAITDAAINNLSRYFPVPGATDRGLQYAISRERKVFWYMPESNLVMPLSEEDIVAFNAKYTIEIEHVDPGQEEGLTVEEETKEQESKDDKKDITITHTYPVPNTDAKELLYAFGSDELIYWYWPETSDILELTMDEQGIFFAVHPNAGKRAPFMPTIMEEEEEE
ncbi:hypothetical protein B0T26DRAFT_806860 [Lasiosphaeria miniovina]|uniref:Uncharacterized protein n=1 Tax=Lasiosphaeria miniovina TaxID=1954250 RepID=A0AA39ZT60_9PEZI|nr:uncharacterized protein B0T26DRAFT_806860 [Lasiosphaeria miniovina]KAK0703152.1 hypothetical protein B0T26DRAFT_806860 [Lasiosphaeria miniovina]